MRCEGGKAVRVGLHISQGEVSQVYNLGHFPSLS